MGLGQEGADLQKLGRGGRNEVERRGLPEEPGLPPRYPAPMLETRRDCPQTAARSAQFRSAR